MCNSVFGGWCWVILGHKFGGGGLAGVREVLGGAHIARGIGRGHIARGIGVDMTLGMRRVCQ